MIAYVKIFLHILCFTLIHTFQELINCKSDVKISMKVCPKKSRFLLFFFFPLLATKKSESEKRFPWKKMPGHRKENAYTEEKSDAEKKFLFQISVFIRTPERKERNYFLVAEEKRRKNKERLIWMARIVYSFCFSEFVKGGINTLRATLPPTLIQET